MSFWIALDVYGYILLLTVNSPHKGQWRGALMFPLICVGINCWINSPEAGDLKRYCFHYDVIVMYMASLRNTGSKERLFSMFRATYFVWFNTRKLWNEQHIFYDLTPANSKINVKWLVLAIPGNTWLTFNYRFKSCGALVWNAALGTGF